MILIALIMLMVCCTLLAWVFQHLRYLWNQLPEVEYKIGLGDLLKTANTGDLILFSGTGRDSSVVKAWSGCRWSHIGMIVVDPKTERRYIYNADPCVSRMNATNGKYQEGVQMNDLEVFIKTYPGYSIYCPLYNINGKIPKVDAIIPLIKEINGKPFNHDWIELLRSTHGKGGGYLGSRTETVDSYFCSQIVAEAYYHMGIFGKRIPFNEYHPASFVGELEADWINGYKTGELSYIAL